MITPFRARRFAQEIAKIARKESQKAFRAKIAKTPGIPPSKSLDAFFASLRPLREILFKEFLRATLSISSLRETVRLPGAPA